MRQRAVLAVVVLTLAFGWVSCGSGDSHFAASSDLSREDQADLNQAVSTTKQWLLSLGNRQLTEFTLFAYSDLNTLMDVLNKEGAFIHNDPATMARFFRNGGAFALGDGVYLYLGPTWRSQSKADRTHVIAHELFHVVQYHSAAGPTGYSIEDVDLGPTWLVEGGAEWAAGMVLHAAGLRRYEDYRTEHVQRAAQLHATLAEMEDLPPVHDSKNMAPYEIGFLAVDQLASDHGDTAVLDFWGALDRDQPWRVAFQQAFGESVDAFYERFRTPEVGESAAR